MLSKGEIKRYSKQLLLPEIGKKGQEALKNARVLVIGAGGLGCPVLQYLAAAGIGTIGVVDFDVVDETNLQRQVLYNTDDIGKPKAIIAAERILKINSNIQAEVLHSRLEPINAVEIITGYDIVVDCSDNFETRYLVNDACVLLDKPFVYGGIYKFEGQLSVFNLKSAEGKYTPTYRCAFPESDTDNPSDCSITGVIGVLTGIVGTMQATEVIKMITGVGEVCSGKILHLNAMTNTFTTIKIKRSEDALSLVPKTTEELKKKVYHAATEAVI